jgi:hypothetical protein
MFAILGLERYRDILYAISLKNLRNNESLLHFNCYRPSRQNHFMTSAGIWRHSLGPSVRP